MQNQIVIQILLIAVFAILTLVLFLPGRGARRLAVRRLVLLAAFVAAVVAIVWPSFVNTIANLLGVGRGTDLVLYALVVVFIAQSIGSASQQRQLHREVTELAREVALRDARVPPRP